MVGISSLGIGSGLDLGNLVESLLAAERIPVENRLNRREADVSSDLSGVGIMNSALTSFKSSLSGLDDASSFSTRTSNNSNSTALGATVTNDAQIGSYNIDVSSIARSQSLAAVAYNATTDTVGTGTIQIRFGTITGPGFTSFAVNPEKSNQTITVDSSNNTLSGLKDHINSGDFGVTATIINDGTGYRLTLTSNDSGAANAMEISITDTGDGNDLDSNGLSAFAYNASATNVVQSQAALNANLTVNGLAITSDSNVLSEVIEGVTLTVNETTSSSLTLDISESQSQLSNSIRGVVSAYNEMFATLNELSFSGTNGAGAGLLSGDASLRNFTSGLRRLMTSQVTGLSGSITALAEIGITTARNGTLSIDETKFGSAIAENPTGALGLFASVGQVGDSLVKFNSSADASLPGSYGINVTAVATQGMLLGATGVNNLTVDANNDNLTFNVNGVSTGSLNLTQGVYASATALAAEIQSQINSASAIKDAGYSIAVNYDSGNDRFEFTSNTYGLISEVEITAIDTNSSVDFGLSVAAGTTGVDVAGTIGGVTATGSGQTLSISNGFSIDILGGVTGARGSLNFSRGFAENLNDFLDSFINTSTGSLALRVDGLNESLEDISDDRLTLNLRMQSVEARLVARFSALDLLVAKFQNTGSFIAQQIENLPGSKAP
jgi:flagellar hook-associated protein 2